MIDYIDFKNKIHEAIANNKGVLFKNFLSKEDTPSWNDLLNCIYQESKEEDSQNINSTEKAYGNVLLSGKLYLASHLNGDKLEVYFSKLNEIINRVRKETGVWITLIGPKICLGPHSIGFHVDSWHALALQCEGKAKWTLSNSQDPTLSTYLEEFYPEPGDLLFFPQGVWHSIETDNAIRGGLQFTAHILDNTN